MGKPVMSSVERVETTGLNTKVSKEVFQKFKDFCAYQGYPMNVMIETFMRQYTNGRYKLSNDQIMKWKREDYELNTLNTTFCKEIYQNFKLVCKGNGYFVRHVIIAFMEDISDKKYILEYVIPENKNH